MILAITVDLAIDIQTLWLGKRLFFSTIGLDEVMVREYIRNQDERDKYFDQQV